MEDRRRRLHRLLEGPLRAYAVVAAGHHNPLFLCLGLAKVLVVVAVAEVGVRNRRCEAVAEGSYQEGLEVDRD